MKSVVKLAMTAVVSAYSTGNMDVLEDMMNPHGTESPVTSGNFADKLFEAH